MLVRQGNQIRTDDAEFPVSFYWLGERLYIEFGAENYTALNNAEARQLLNYITEGLEVYDRR